MLMNLSILTSEWEITNSSDTVGFVVVVLCFSKSGLHKEDVNKQADENNMTFLRAPSPVGVPLGQV